MHWDLIKRSALPIGVGPTLYDVHLFNCLFVFFLKEQISLKCHATENWKENYVDFVGYDHLTAKPLSQGQTQLTTNLQEDLFAHHKIWRKNERIFGCYLNILPWIFLSFFFFSKLSPFLFLKQTWTCLPHPTVTHITWAIQLQCRNMLWFSVYTH